MRIALYQPDIAGNVGTILRLGACFGVATDIIEPCGFPFSERALRRSAMDYAAAAMVARHADWAAFLAARQGRIILFTTRGGDAAARHGVPRRRSSPVRLGKRRRARLRP